MAAGDKYLKTANRNLNKEQLFRLLCREDENGKPFLNVNAASGPVSVLQPWYDSLSVKPSEGLWTDLKIMADGMDADGDWSEADFIGLLAGLETDEQRLRPLKTTSGEDLIPVFSPTLDVNGMSDPAIDGVYLDTKWNAADDGIKYALNSAFAAVYLKQSSGSYVQNCFMSDNTSIVAGSANLTSVNSVGSYINGGSSGTIGKVNFTSGNNKSMFISLKRISSTQFVVGINDTFQTVTSSSTSLPTTDFILNGLEAEYQRFVITGSSLIDHNRVANRLNTFFSSRGLSIANY